MSTLAKIFVVFNLVLTVVFFGSAATLYLNRENWRAKFLEYRTETTSELERVKTRFEGQARQISKTAEDNASLLAQVADLTTTKQSQTTTIEELKNEVNTRELTVQKHLTALTEREKTLQEKERAISEKDTLIAQLRDNEQQARTAQEKAVRDVTRLALDYDKLSTEYSQLQIQSTDLHDQLTNAQITLDALAQSGIDVERPAVPFIDGVVEAVNEEDKLVVLSVGKDQKVQAGYDMFVHRAGDYIGKLKVIKVYDDLSGASVVYTAPGRMVKVGDRVKTTQ